MIKKNKKTDIVVCFCALFLSLAAGLFLGANIKLLYEISNVKAYSWDRRPNVINCFGEEFKRDSMLRAIKYWERKGENFGFYDHTPPKKLCRKNKIPGFIILKKDKNQISSKTALAATRRYTSFTTMVSAVIYYRHNNYELHLLNEHELGHALGYSHVKKLGHIMHPSFHLMGPYFYIP
tara:strand:+ start:2058 stop:2594 length:537 start_codon:yes stop_codon:yes gene_type:complete